MDEFNPSGYGPAFGPLLAIDRDRDLGRGLADRAWLDQLAPLTVEAAFEHTTVADHDLAAACVAGVWLLHDFLDESHAISQAIDTPEGSFWHGVMHRREGDFGNSKYWFRRVGHHPVFDALAERFGQWDPFDFVDACQAEAAGAGPKQDDARSKQQAEWETLFDYCYRHATA